jgi:hypothetical protein
MNLRAGGAGPSRAAIEQNISQKRNQKMDADEIRFETKALEVWANDGGFGSPDEELAEKRRMSLSELRAWAELLTENANDARLLLEILGGRINLTEFGASLGLDRSNGKRRFDAYVVELKHRAAERPGLLAALPDPWRTLLLDS